MFFNTLCIRHFVALSILLCLCAVHPVLANASNAQDTATAQYTADETIHIIVEGESELSGTYNIDKDGTIQMPLIGVVKTTGKTGPQIQHDIVSRLSDGYIKDPTVIVKAQGSDSTKIVNGKSIYIIGEVANPGHYTLSKDAGHVLNIVAMAGGYTEHANTDEFEIVRNIEGTHYRQKAKTGALEYLEGDIIIIKERF